MTAAHQFEFSTQIQWEQDMWWSHSLYGTQKTYDAYVAALTALRLQGTISHKAYDDGLDWAGYRLASGEADRNRWWKRLWRRLEERAWRRLFVRGKSS